MDIVDKIQRQFDLDADAVKANQLGKAAARTTLSPEAAHDLCEVASKLADAAAARDDWDLAVQFAKLAMTAVRRTKDPQFSRDVSARGHEIEHLKTRYAVVAKAMETLGSDADNAEANLTVGQILETQAPAQPKAAERTPAAGPKSHQRGNVALLENGTGFLGKVRTNSWKVMFDGVSTSNDPNSYAESPPPFEWMVILGKVYSLREIRFKFVDSPRFNQYRISSSVNGKIFSLLADRSKGEWRDWQMISFPARPVKFIKFEGLFASPDDSIAIVEFEAYCFPPSADGSPGPRPTRAGK